MALVAARLEAFAERYKDGYTYTLDGLLLRLNLEALTPELMHAKRDEVPPGDPAA